MRHWDVYVDPEKGLITKIYMVKQFNAENQVTTQQLTWQADKSAKIATIAEKDGKTTLLKEELLVWNFR